MIFISKLNKILRNRLHPAVSFVDVKEVYDLAYAAINEPKDFRLLIRKANRLQERYLQQMQNSKSLKGALL